MSKEIGMSELETALVLVYLSTEEIVETEVTNVRPWSSKVGDSEAEIKRIEALAATIEQEGQLQPVKVRRRTVRPDDGPGVGIFAYELIMGRRRKRAIELINAGRPAGEEMMKVCAVVSADDDELSDPSAFRQAAIENWHREGLSAMDMCVNIATVRKNFKWQGTKGTHKVAEFFKVSGATVTQYETLARLPDEMQAKVHRGELSRDDAFRLAAIVEANGVEAAEEAEQKGVEAEEAVVKQEVFEAEVEGRAVKNVGKKRKAARSLAIRNAAREADTGRSVPRKRNEIIEYFKGMRGPAYGHPNGAVHRFVDNFLRWSAGEVQNRTLDVYWDAMVEKASKGTSTPLKSPTVKKYAAKKK
jgi:ParB/RepB/Spo0J family partition protein